MKKFDATKPWVLMQETRHGPRYYTGKEHPFSPDAWTESIERAGRFTSAQVGNMREWVNAHTMGNHIQRVRA